MVSDFFLIATLQSLVAEYVSFRLIHGEKFWVSVRQLLKTCVLLSRYGMEGGLPDSLILSEKLNYVFQCMARGVI